MTRKFPFRLTTNTEEKNAENLLIIESSDLARLYMENWKAHKEHSQPYEARY